MISIIFLVLKVKIATFFLRCPDCAAEFLFCFTYLSYHATVKHKITLADFKAKYLQIEPENPNLSMTNDKMATSLKHEEKYYSNNMSELCKYKCLTCGEENIEVKSTHTNNVHPEIKRKYKMMEIVLHR